MLWRQTLVAWLLMVLVLAPGAARSVHAQGQEGAVAARSAGTQRRAATQFLRGRLAGRASEGASEAAEARLRAGMQAAALLAQRAVNPLATANFSAAWTPLGPVTVSSLSFGAVTGRVTTVAVDPNDATGNTVYLGTTGGGVWKSTNAAGPLASASFAPLTDTLPVFSANAGSALEPSLSMGAVAVQPVPNPVVLAGTGDPNDATDSLYGEGVLRSVNGGSTWTIVTGSHDGVAGNHSFAGLATAAIAWSTGTPTLAVMALTTSPESAVVSATKTTSVPGLYASRDAGVTWQMATVYDGSQVVQQPEPIGTPQGGVAATSVVWNPVRKLFFAALRSHGYYSSSDGLTWKRLAVQPGAGLTTVRCPVGFNGAGSLGCPIFRGTLAVQPVTGDMYALTVDANDGDQGLWQDLCAATGSGCSTAAPTWAHRVDNGALETGDGGAGGNTPVPQGDYNLALAAVPATLASGHAAGTDTVLLAGTEDVYRCAMTSGTSACVMRNTTNAVNGCAAPAGVAASQHALAGVAQAGGAPLVFAGNDGGLWRSTDGIAETGSACSASDRTHFDNLNAAIGVGGSLAEVVGFAEHPTAADTLLVGLGAGGSASTERATQLPAWGQLAAGEGGLPQIESNDPTHWLVAIGAGVALKACTDGVDCTAAGLLPPATIGSAQVAGDAGALDVPNLLDPAASAEVVLGTCRVWRGSARAGTTWGAANAISKSLDGGAMPCTASSATIRSLAVGGPAANSANLGDNGSTVLYAGMAGALDGGGGVAGHVFVTTAGARANAGTAWTDAARSPVANDVADVGVFNPAGFDVSSLAMDPHDATGGTVYATVMGFGTLTQSSPHVYRSLDFGAHWTNLSSNLPDTPANAVLVDPNDAMTVYVATDAGVYATTAVSTCTTANCWTVLGSGLPNAPAVSLEAATLLATGDGRHGMLRVGTYGRGLWQTPLLSAAGVAQPAITLSSTSLSFAAQQVGTQSAAQVVTVTSSGNAPAVFGTPTIADGFVENDTCEGATLAAGATCSFSVVFAPTATGAANGLLTIFADVTGGQATVSLSGVGTTPAAVVLTPLSLQFAATTVNATTASQIITVANTGQNAATLGVPVLSGDFTLTANTCGATLASQNSCSLAIAFAPTAAGKRTGTLTVTDSAGTQVASLTGTGQAPATDTLTPGALVFGQQAIGTTSAAQTVTLTNAGDVPLTLLSAALSPGADFTAVNSCGNSLAAHASCSVQVSFVPTAVGTQTATLTFTDQVRYQTVTLTGVGVAPPGVSLSPARLDFGQVGVGLSAAPQVLTLTNNGGQPLAIRGTVASAGFTVTATTCGSSLQPGEACTMGVVFAPGASGAATGSLTLSDNAPTGTPPGQQTASFTGTGVDFALASNGSAVVTVADGGSAAFPLLLSSDAGLAGGVTLTCSGSPANSTCLLSPTAGTLGGSVSVVATVQTGVTASPAMRRVIAGSSRGATDWGARMACAAALALLGPWWWPAGRRRRRLSGMWLVLLLAVVGAGLSGCGAARLIPLSGTGSGGGASTGSGGLVTPAGTYTVTVSASAAGLTRSVPLTLTVQ